MASQYLDRLVDIFSSHRAASLSALGIAVALPFVISDYLLYMSYGAHGLPNNAKGWLMASAGRLFAAEQLSTSVYSDQKLPLADKPSFLPASFPPPRASERPRISPHPAPQRQLAQLPREEARQKLIERFTDLGKRGQEKGLVEIRQSMYERQHDAIFVSKTRQWHAIAEQTRGEISHIHAGYDGSIHVVLHPSDCKTIIEAGWGQRHAFSGVAALKKVLGFALPINYTLIYAPRDEAELNIALTIVKASIEFMTGTRGELE